MEVETTEAFEKDMTNRFAQAEIRLRRIAQQDVQAALRGQLMDLVAQVERKAEDCVRTEVTRLIQPYVDAHNQSQQRFYKMLADDNERLKKEREAFHKSFEDQVAAVVLQILREYYVLDERNCVLDHNQKPVNNWIMEPPVSEATRLGPPQTPKAA